MDDGPEETEEAVDGGFGSCEAQEHSTMTDQHLWTRYLWGEITFGTPDLWRDSCRLCIRLLTIGLISPLVGAGPTLLRFQDFIGIIFRFPRF